MSTTIKVSQLPAAVTPLTGDETIMIVQSGTSRRATTSDISTSSGTVSVTRGGTGLTSFAQGDLIYATAGTTLAALAKSTSATRYLSNTGASNGPAWAQIDLSNGVSGILPIANGGTGQATANAALNALLPNQGGESGNFLTTNGTDASWAAAGAAATPDLIFIAANVGGTPGYSNFGTTGGTLIFESSRLSGVFGFAGIALNSLAPSELEFRAQGIFSQSDFTALELSTWGQTLLTADAIFSTGGGNSIWFWTSPEADMVVSGQYSFRFT